MFAMPEDPLTNVAVTFVILDGVPSRIERALDELERRRLCAVTRMPPEQETGRTIWIWNDRPDARRRRDVVIYRGRPPRWARDWLDQSGTALLKIADNDDDQLLLLRQLAGLPPDRDEV